ncbi:MAG: hypothetical protein GYA24_18570 [Candidatus Lokiarchaeota archaeon]|nr:hypothetical protein [Candidatus Lokiarchaeota archaeon]
MNEFKVISFMLARRGDTIGATDEELVAALGLQGKGDIEALYRLMQSYSSSIELFGFKVERNTLDGHWFLACTDDLSSHARINPFQGRTRLASTLVATLIATTCDDEGATIEQIRRMRNIKDVAADLKELESLGLVKVKGNKVLLTERVGYYVDVARFMRQFKEHVNDKYK